MNHTLGTSSVQASSTNTIPRNIELRTITCTATNHMYNCQVATPAKTSPRVEHATSSSYSTEVESSWPHLPNQQERNSFTTIFIIFVTMIMTHIPIYCTSVLEHIGNLYVSIPLVIHLSAVYVFLLGVLINSVVIMRNKDFRDVLVHLVRKYTGRGHTCPRSEVNSSTVSVEGTGIHRNGDQANSLE